MKRRWYKSNVTKAVLIIIAHILVIVMAASFIWIVSYPALREEIFAGKPAKKYEDSRSFADQMLNYCQQAMYGVRGADLFETEGKYNPDKIVDIQVCHRDNTITGEESSGLAYRLGDLIEWTENTDEFDGQEELPASSEENAGDIADDAAGLSELPASSEESTGDIVVCKTAEDTYHYYKMSEFYKRIHAGELTIDMDESDREGTLFQEGEIRQIRDKSGKVVYINAWIYDGCRETERFAPIGADSVIEIANNDRRWNGRLNEAYSMIGIVKNSLQEQFKNYQSAGDDIEEGETNLSYIYADTLNK